MSLEPLAESFEASLPLDQRSFPLGSIPFFSEKPIRECILKQSERLQSLRNSHLTEESDLLCLDVAPIG